jgi:hypothetical protein
MILLPFFGFEFGAGASAGAKSNSPNGDLFYHVQSRCQYFLSYLIVYLLIIAAFPQIASLNNFGA